MNRQALVGIFTVVALIGLFGFFLVLANVGPQGRYKIGVHFKSAAGLHKGALVYESGVVVGVVDQTNLIPEDFTVEVVLAINNNVDVPRNARFLIQAPLTGDSDLEIVPVVPPAAAARDGRADQRAGRGRGACRARCFRIDQQPQGTNPATIQDLLDQGQGETRRLDRMLAQLENEEPALLNTLQSALNNANHVSVTANRSFTNLSRRLDSLTTTLQVALAAGSANLNDITGQLDTTVRRNSGHFDAIVAALDASSRDLNRTADQVTALSSDPQLRANILQTTQGIAQTATTFASIAKDLHNVSGNPQTQAQLRDTVANVDAASQKANSLLAQFGGQSSVYGVDRGATPAPAGSPAPGGRRSGGAPARKRPRRPGGVPSQREEQSRRSGAQPGRAAGARLRARPAARRYERFAAAHSRPRPGDRREPRRAAQRRDLSLYRVQRHRRARVDGELRRDAASRAALLDRRRRPLLPARRARRLLAGAQPRSWASTR